MENINKDLLARERANELCIKTYMHVTLLYNCVLYVLVDRRVTNHTSTLK